MNHTHRQGPLAAQLTNTGTNDSKQERGLGCPRRGKKGYTVGLKFFSTKNEAMMTRTRKSVLL